VRRANRLLSIVANQVEHCPLRVGLVHSWCGRHCQRRSSGGEMKNPLDSLWGTVIVGLVLTAILYWVVKMWIV
jgi:hypothetical protein